jgi:hypothetical protein
VSATAASVSCHGGSDGTAQASFTGGTGNATYQWSTGDFGEKLSELAAGTYSVTATDANGCTASASVTISQPDQLQVSATAASVSCHGGSDGTAQASFTGGTGNATYQWSTGNFGEKLSELTAGTYSVTATDANGCTASAQIEIKEPPQIVVVIDQKIDEVASNMGGAIGITLSGGVGAPYSVEWHLNGVLFSTAEDLTGLSAGTYVLQAKDANGCLFTQTVVIENLTSVREAELEKRITLQPNPSSGKFSLLFELPENHPVKVTVFDVAGKQVMPTVKTQSSQKAIPLDLTGEPAGVYLLRIVIDDVVVTKRIAVQR